jgi:hypothetical protein
VGRSRFGAPEKEKPGGGNAGSGLFSYRSLRFQYAAWLLLVMRQNAERLVVIFQPIFFLFFYFLVLL